MPERRAFVFRVVQSLDFLPQARPGDFIVVQPGGAEPVKLIRRLPPNYGALLGALEDGVLESVTLEAGVAADLLALLDAATPPDPVFPSPVPPRQPRQQRGVLPS